jgi:hypothetical protein
VLEVNLEDATRLLVHEPADTLHATTARDATVRILGDALDVVAEYLCVALGPALAQPLCSFATPAGRARDKTDETRGAQQRALVANSEQYGSAGPTRS